MEGDEEVVLERDSNVKLSVMVWGAIAYGNKLQLVCVDHRMNAKKYIEMLDDYVIHVIQAEMGEDAIFQQDNAPCHQAHQTLTYLADQVLEVLDWPPKSPDLNPIENVWSILSALVYTNEENIFKERGLVGCDFGCME